MTNQPHNTQELDKAIRTIFNVNHRGTLYYNHDIADILDYQDVYDAKQAILDWHNKQVKAVLDRLESMAAYDPSGSSPVINPRQIEAERNKLKESEDE